MGDFLKTNELTETRAFIRSFVKEVQVKPGKATIIYSIPTPEDSPRGGLCITPRVEPNRKEWTCFQVVNPRP